ncbi:MAG: hypothetical protein RTU30_14565 [Candidatus Thorarchaeota archaeon]
MRGVDTHYVIMKRVIKYIRSFLSRKNRLKEAAPLVRSIVFTPQYQIVQYEDVAKDFIEAIVGVPYSKVFISDRSSIWDFNNLWDEDESEIFARIRERYGVDVSDIEDGNLVRIFERIS